MQWPNEPIEDLVMVYTAAGVPASLRAGNLVVALYDESNNLQVAPGISEIGVTAMYRIEFTPDAIGSWKVRWSGVAGVDYFEGVVRQAVPHVFDVRDVPADTADQVFDEQKAGHTAANSYGKIIQDLETNLATVDGVVDGIEVHVHATDGYIQADYSATEKAAIDLLDDPVGGLADIHADLVTVDAVIDDIDADVGEPTDAVGTNTLHGKLGSAAEFAGHDSIKQELIDGITVIGGDYKIKGI